MKTYRTVKRYRRLRGALVAAGIDQADLADILHMSPTSVSKEALIKAGKSQANRRR